MSKNIHSILSIFSVLTLHVGCSDNKDAACGDHGEMHGDHCHCDSGFALSDDGSVCEPVEEDPENEFAFAPSEVQASTGTSNNTQIWLLEAIDEDVQLNIEIYESYGGISSPGSIIIDDVEMNYATCGTCVLLKTGCEAHGDHFHCARTFMPSEGEVRIDATGTSAGDAFTGELIGITFQEVTIDQDYQTEPVVDGIELKLSSWSFDTLLDEFATTRIQ